MTNASKQDEILSIVALPRDLRSAAASLGRDEARYLVDTYYQMQSNRMAANNQDRDLIKSGEPHLTIGFFAKQFLTLEKQIAGSLKVFAEGDPLGVWAMKNYGIGPVITAGLLAHIDITQAPTVGHIWRFAGLDPTVVWGKGEKRPHNAKLKVLCWKMGESFKKFSGKDECFYGRIYRERKEYEVARNDAVLRVPEGVLIKVDENGFDGTFVLDGTLVSCYRMKSPADDNLWFYGGNAQWASSTLLSKNIKDADTLARYREGKLPDGRLDLRATRYAAKLFLSHYHAEAFRLHYGEEPPLPYPIAHLGHAHLIESPVESSAGEAA